MHRSPTSTRAPPDDRNAKHTPAWYLCILQRHGSCPPRATGPHPGSGPCRGRPDPSPRPVPPSSPPIAIITLLDTKADSRARGIQSWGAQVPAAAASASLNTDELVSLAGKKKLKFPLMFFSGPMGSTHTPNGVASRPAGAAGRLIPLPGGLLGVPSLYQTRNTMTP